MRERERRFRFWPQFCQDSLYLCLYHSRISVLIGRLYVLKFLLARLIAWHGASRAAPLKAAVTLKLAHAFWVSGISSLIGWLYVLKILLARLIAWNDLTHARTHARTHTHTHTHKSWAEACLLKPPWVESLFFAFLKQNTRAIRLDSITRRY